MRYVGFAPYVMKNSGKLTGTDVQVLEFFSQIFKLKMNFSQGITWGRAIDPEMKHWSGVVGDVVNGTCDIGIGHFSVTWERLRVVDYLILYALDTHFITTKPNILPKSWNLIKPFTFEVWVCIILMLFFAIFTFIVISSHNEDYVRQAMVIIESHLNNGKFIMH